MVQLFYHENRGNACKKLLQHDGYPTKILLYPYEGWAHPASITYWVLKTPWWSRTRCKIIEVTGSKKRKGHGKMCELDTEGSMVITGKFKQTDKKKNIVGGAGVKDINGRDFKLLLSSDVSNADFQMGYSMTGTLERGSKKGQGHMEMTHFAMIKRKGY